MEENLQQRTILTENTVNENPRGCLPPPWGYIHVFSHYFQTSFSLKPLGQSMPNLMWSLLGEVGKNFYRNDTGHMTKNNTVNERI